MYFFGGFSYEDSSELSFRLRNDGIPFVSFAVVIPLIIAFISASSAISPTV